MATRYWRISRGSTESSRYRSHSCWTAACSRSVPSGRVGDAVRRGGPPDWSPCRARVERIKAANVMSVEIGEEGWGQVRHIPSARLAHPASKHTPPAGVTAPNARAPVSASTYRDPEKSTVPATNSHPAARTGGAGQPVTDHHK